MILVEHHYKEGLHCRTYFYVTVAGVEQARLDVRAGIFTDSVPPEDRAELEACEVVKVTVEVPFSHDREVVNPASIGLEKWGSEVLLHLTLDEVAHLAGDLDELMSPFIGPLLGAIRTRGRMKTERGPDGRHLATHIELDAGYKVTLKTPDAKPREVDLDYFGAVMMTCSQGDEVLSLGPERASNREEVIDLVRHLAL